MLLDKSIEELAKGLRQKKFSCEDIIKECYQAIEKLNRKLNAFITVVDKKKALKIARDKDKKNNSVKSKLYGIPFCLKDTYVTKGIRTTCASSILDSYVPQYSATVYQKLLDAGAILVGKTNMDAWGHGASSENTDYGPVKNPWNSDYVAGGSSGGSAAAISARMALFSIGEDTGGSIRNPAAWTNTVGLKVTYGRVSRYGTIAYASSFDTVGPMAKTAEDCAHILEAIAGRDDYDATSAHQSVPKYSESLSREIKNLTVGVPMNLFGERLNKELKEAIMQAIKKLQKMGVQVKEISMSIFDYAIPLYYLVGLSETSSNLARYDGIRYGTKRSNFTEESMRRIMVGSYALSAGYYDAYYRQAQKARTLAIKEYQKIFSRCDIIIMPVTSTPPTKIGELISDPLLNMLADIYTTSQNPVGIPSLAIPCGFTRSNLPIGMQLIGKMFSEELLLKVGHAYQQVTDWHKRKPSL